MRAHESTLLQIGFRGAIAWAEIAPEERGCDPVMRMRATTAGAFLEGADRGHLRSFDVADLVQLSVRA